MCFYVEVIGAENKHTGSESVKVFLEYSQKHMLVSKLDQFRDVEMCRWMDGEVTTAACFTEHYHFKAQTTNYCFTRQCTDISTKKATSLCAKQMFFIR